VNTQASALRVCVGCGAAATRVVGGDYVCDGSSCHKEQGTRNKDKGSTEGGSGLYVVPSPSGNFSAATPKSASVTDFTPRPIGPPARKKREEPELYGLVRDYERGLLEPIEVELGDLPAVGSRAPCFDGRLTVVTEAMHTVAADIRLLLGLRLAVSEDRPLPYSTRLCAERCGLPDHRAASRVLRSLERLGVVKCAGKLKLHGNPYGTKLYEAP
jgi:hypothetical protein